MSAASLKRNVKTSQERVLSLTRGWKETSITTNAKANLPVQNLKLIDENTSNSQPLLMLR